MTDNMSEALIEKCEKERIERTKAAAAELPKDGTPEPTNEIRKMRPENILAETVARAIAGSGINRARNAVLAADKAAAEATLKNSQQ
jgi:hypothetical protein